MDARAFMQRFFDEVWTNGRVDRIDEWVSTDCLIHGLGAPMRGNDAFKQFHAAMSSGYCDFAITLEEVIVDGERAAMRATFRAVHIASGKPIAFGGGGICRIHDETIVEAWNMWDFLSLAHQIGVLAPDGIARTFAGKA
jgi:predicted ester cyclase